MQPIHCSNCHERFACDIDGKITLCIHCKAKDHCEKAVKHYVIRGMCYHCIRRGIDDKKE